MQILVSDTKEPNTKEIEQAHVWIKIWITPGGEFRASIQKNRSGEKGEITVGGENWKQGKFREYHADIVRRFRKIADAMKEKADGFSSCPWVE